MMMAGVASASEDNGTNTEYFDDEENDNDDLYEGDELEMNDTITPMGITDHGARNSVTSH